VGKTVIVLISDKHNGFSNDELRKNMIELFLIEELYTVKFTLPTNRIYLSNKLNPLYNKNPETSREAVKFIKTK